MVSSREDQINKTIKKTGVPTIVQILDWLVAHDKPKLVICSEIKGGHMLVYLLTSLC